jgi:hypothetical protein
LDFRDDLVEPHALQIVLVEDGSSEKKGETSEVIHPGPRRHARPKVFGVSHDKRMTRDSMTDDFSLR